MASAEDEIEKLARKQTRIEEMGGSVQVAKQHEKGKMTARERIDLFFDEGTFNEIDAFVRHRSNNFGLDKQEIPGRFLGFKRNS